MQGTFVLATPMLFSSGNLLPPEYLNTWYELFIFCDFCRTCSCLSTVHLFILDFLFFAIWVQVYANITALLWTSWHIATKELHKFCNALYLLSNDITKVFIICEQHTFTLLYNNCYLVPHETRYITHISNIVCKKWTTNNSITYSHILQTVR